MQIKHAIDNQIHAQMVEARENNKEAKIPMVQITGENYKVTGIKGTIAYIASYGNMIALMLMFFGEAIIGMAGGPSRLPKVVNDANAYIQENKMYFFGMVFLFSSML